MRDTNERFEVGGLLVKSPCGISPDLRATRTLTLCKKTALQSAVVGWSLVSMTLVFTATRGLCHLAEGKGVQGCWDKGSEFPAPIPALSRRTLDSSAHRRLVLDDGSPSVRRAGSHRHVLGANFVTFR
ncbi:unnamed protein product [Arctogadus glacialis]